MISDDDNTKHYITECGVKVGTPVSHLESCLYLSCNTSYSARFLQFSSDTAVLIVHYKSDGSGVVMNGCAILFHKPCVHCCIQNALLCTTRVRHDVFGLETGGMCMHSKIRPFSHSYSSRLLVTYYQNYYRWQLTFTLFPIHHSKLSALSHSLLQTHVVEKALLNRQMNIKQLNFIVLLPYIAINLTFSTNNTKLVHCTVWDRKSERHGDWSSLSPVIKILLKFSQVSTVYNFYNHSSTHLWVCTAPSLHILNFTQFS